MWCPIPGPCLSLEENPRRDSRSSHFKECPYLISGIKEWHWICSIPLSSLKKKREWRENILTTSSTIFLSWPRHPNPRIHTARNFQGQWEFQRESAWLGVILRTGWWSKYLLRVISGQLLTSLAKVRIYEALPSGMVIKKQCSKPYLLIPGLCPKVSPHVSISTNSGGRHDCVKGASSD